MLHFLLLFATLCFSGTPVSPEIEQAKQLFLKSETFPPDSQERIGELKEAVRWAQTARDKKTDPKAALYWWTTVYSEWVLTQGLLTALGAIAELEKAMLELRDLDPQYENAAADRVLGRLYHQAPGWISIGSNAKARKHYQEALRRAPDYAGNLLLYADFLKSQGEEKEARQLAAKGKKALDSVTPYEKKRWLPIASEILGDSPQ